MILLAALCFSGMTVFVRLSGNLPSFQKSFFRNLVAFFIALFIMLHNRQGFHVGKGNWKYMLMRAVFGTLGILCNFYAIDRLVLADANILNKMSPFFAILFSFLLLRERISLVQMGSVFIAFIGSMFVVKPSFSNVALFPAFMGLLGGIGAGAAYTMVRILGQRGQESSSIVLFFSGFSTITMLPLLLWGGAPMSGMQLLYLMLAGVCAAGGQFAITKAYFYAPAKELSVFDYAQVLFSAFFGYFLFDQIPDLLSIVGYLLICGTAVFMFVYNNRSVRKDKKNDFASR